MQYFQVAMLASGSKGNATVINAGEQYFLIDMGLSCRELVARLKRVHLEPAQLTAVFITHEHSDHIKGLATFSKKYAVPLYSSAKTWRAILAKEKSINRSSCHIIDTKVSYNNIEVKSFEIPHDASDPHGYMFENRAIGAKCTYVTDTGFVTDTVRQAVEGAELLILEANHDVEMLKNGSYPAPLKQRILSTRGHLSNDSAGWLLAQMQQLPQNVFLAHLSEENNRPELALQTVQAVLTQAGNEQNINIYVASQHEVVSNFAPQESNIFGEAMKE